MTFKKSYQPLTELYTKSSEIIFNLYIFFYYYYFFF